MYLPRSLISLLYDHLRRTRHALSPPVLVLVALEPDALCAARILTTLFKGDYIEHNVVPVAGYYDLAKAGEQQVQPMRIQSGGSGGIVVCIGVGGLIDLAEILGLEPSEDEPGSDGPSGVEVWVIDARRPWNLGNVFGGRPPDPVLAEISANGAARDTGSVTYGEVRPHYQPGKGGIIVFDDDDIGDHLGAEREAYFQLQQLPPIDEDAYGAEDRSPSPDGDGDVDDHDERETSPQRKSKRKSWSDAEDEENNEGPPSRRQRSDSGGSAASGDGRGTAISLESPTRISDSAENRPILSSPSAIPPSHQGKPMSTRHKRRRLLRMKRQYEATLNKYYGQGNSYAEPVSSLLYSLASEIGREDNDLLWQAIVGVSSLELYGRTMHGVGVAPASESGGSAGWGGDRGEIIRQVLRDEVNRLNPLEDSRGPGRGELPGGIPTTASSPSDHAIRLSPEPRFLLVRHWSLYESMLYSPYLAARLHLWTAMGERRLHNLLAKLGVSLAESRQEYRHMNMATKRDLRQQLLRIAPRFGLDGLVPPEQAGDRRAGWGFVRCWGFSACLSAVDVGVIVGSMLEGSSRRQRLSHAKSKERQDSSEPVDEDGRLEDQEYVDRFWDAYDALADVTMLLAHLPATEDLHRAIFRTGSALLTKKQLRVLNTFRVAVMKDGPDLPLFTHPGALTKLALWVGNALMEQEKSSRNSSAGGGKEGLPLVLAALNERRGVYVVVGTGGGNMPEPSHRKSAARLQARAERRKAKEASRQTRQEDKRRLRDERRAARKTARKAARASRREADTIMQGSDGEEDDAESAGSDSSAASTATESEGSSTDTSSSSDEDNDDAELDDHPMVKRNRFGHAFQAVVAETGTHVKIDSFEHCVVEVRREDMTTFLETLSRRHVVG